MYKAQDRVNGIEQLADRLLDFAVKIIELVRFLPQTYVGKYVGSQLMRSGTSSGANYEEACGAESRADFIHKLGIVLKELKESRFWLNLIVRTRLVKSEKLEALQRESHELCAIIAKSIFTAKENKK
ncbi:MAG: four helix bundle protein [Candidatus Omnitrophica bacterium]|nr:four helix bundle protein [Candidatus Omnitrophota bacterium]